MDKNEAVSGAAQPVVINGQTYLLGPGTLADWMTWKREARRQLQEAQVSPLAAVAKQLKDIPPEHRQVFVEAAIAAQGGTGKVEPSAEQIKEQMAFGIDCIRFILVHLARKNHPDLKFGCWDEFITEDNATDFFPVVMASLRDAAKERA